MDTEAGPQLDMAVAKACGFKPRVIHDFDRGAIVHIETGRSVAGVPLLREFSPSVDVNNAFEAAEKVGLFGSNGGWLFRFLGEGDHPGTWAIYEYYDKLKVVAGNAPSAAVAICLAILKLTYSIAPS